jgi:hypothetical protein
MFFTPREVKWTRSAFEALRSADPDLTDPAFVKLVRLRIDDKERTKSTIIDGGLSPEAVAVLIITNVAWDWIISGQLHAYRGTLSMRGKIILRVFDRYSDRLVGHGIKRPEESTEEKKVLRSEIGQLG